MITETQRKERLLYIGASDCAGVLGLSRWKTPLALWAEKTGQVVPEDISGKLHIRVGNELEDLVRKLFSEESGKTVHRVNETITHSSYPFIKANLDGRIVGEKAGFEAKTCNGWAAKSWEGEEIPQEYILQCMHSLAVTGWDRWYIAVLIGGNSDFRWKTVERDEKIISQIVKAEVEFWKEFVEPEIMPITIKKDDGDVLAQLFPMAEGEQDPVELDDEADRLIESIQAQIEDFELLKGNIETDKNRLKVLLKDKPVGESDLYKVTWKEQTSRRVDLKKLKEEFLETWRQCSKPSTSRPLRIAKKKLGGKDGN